MSDWVVYLLRCADGTLYGGTTNDLDRRLALHNAGRGARYTRARRPVALAWSSTPCGKREAHRLEWIVKRMPKPAKERLVAKGTRAQRF